MHCVFAFRTGVFSFGGCVCPFVLQEKNRYEYINSKQKEVDGNKDKKKTRRKCL
jgi:hypothetical protein